MNWAHDLLEFPVVQQIGRALLHSLWEGVAIAAILWLALTLLRSRGATARYLSACAAMLMMAAAPLVTLLVLPPAPRAQATRESGSTPHAATAGETGVVPMADQAGWRASRAVAAPATSGRDAIMPAGMPARSDDTAVPTSATAAHTQISIWQQTSDWASRSAPWLALCWIAGVLAMSLWNLGAWTATQRLKLSRTQPIGPEIQTVAARLANRLGLDRAVRILQSALIDSPLVIGAIKPVILLPASMLTDLPVAHLEALLAHELAHVLRHDYLVNLLQAVVETLLFYHPAVWWISSRIRTERENCCDDLAIAVTRDRAAYVRALARVAGAMGPTLAPAASGGELLPRLRRVLGKPDSDAAGSRWIAGAALLCVCAGLVVFIAAHKVSAQNAAPQPTVPAATQPSATRTLEITVIDLQTKRPLAGARVGRYTSAGRASSNTDAAGKVSIPLPDGTDFMNLTVRQDAYVPTMVLWNPKAPIPASFTLPVEPGTTIGGKVVDEQGRPIADASVGLWIQPKNIPTEPPSGTPFMQIYDLAVKTGADGKWTCDFAPKEFSSVSLRVVHSDFVPDDLYGRSSKSTPEEFHNETAMAVMKRGTKVAGRVVDEEGKPIAGSIVSLGGRTMGVKSPTTQTAADGAFLLAHCEPGVRAPLIVTAKDHASSMTEVVVDKEIAGLEVKLANPRPLIVQVVDAKGSPVADTRVMLKRWRGLDSIDWEAHTDADGKATWIEAPLEGATFAFSHPGFMYQNNHSLLSGDGPQIVSLLPQLKVVASILDDATGQPIPKFKVVKGYLSGRDRIFWEQGARNGMVEGANGKFEMLENDDRDGYAIRIEADGYLPGESKIYHMADGEVRFDFRLNKSADISGTLVSEDGKPLAGAHVLAVVPGVQIFVNDGQIGNSTFAQQTTADDAGLFKLPPQKGKFLVMVVHDRAYALLTPQQLNGANRWVIPPWGSVQGTASIGTKPAAGKTVTAHSQILKEGASKNSIDEDFGSVSLRCSTPVDSTGHFLLTHVPPGSVYVGILVQWGESRSRLSMSGQTQVTRLDIEAGKTTPLTLGGTGRAVVGRVVVPPSLKEQVDWNHGFFNISSRLHLPGRALPADWDKLDADQRAKWNEQWRNSPEVQAYEKELENRKNYPVVIGADGTFRAEDVVAGTYTLSITAEKASGQPFKIETIATASQEFTMPPMPTGRSDEPLDVGTVGLAEKTGAKLNEAAPALDAKTVDGKPFSLADYRGKFVLIDFWATWCGPCVEEMPYLKATYEAFAKDSRFAMISLSLDEKVESPRQFAANQGLKWTQGFLGDWSTSDIPNKWGVQGIPAVFLIGPDGKVLDTGLRGDAIQAAVTRALGAPVAQ